MTTLLTSKMAEKILIISYCIVIAFLYSLNFNKKWNDRTFEKLKNRNTTWYWFKIFNIEQTKENYTKMIKGCSIFFCIITIIFFILAKILG